MNPKKYVQSIFKQPTVFFLFVVLFVQRNPLKIFGYQGASSGHRRASKLGLNHTHTHTNKLRRDFFKSLVNF